MITTSLTYATIRAIIVLRVKLIMKAEQAASQITWFMNHRKYEQSCPWHTVSTTSDLISTDQHGQSDNS